MTRTISSTYQSGPEWPPYGDPFDDDIDENGDWITVPEVEVSLPEDGHDRDDQPWIRPRFYRLGSAPRLGGTRTLAAPSASDERSPNGRGFPDATEDEPARIDSRGAADALPESSKPLLADFSEAPAEPPDPLPEPDALSTADRNRHHLLTVRTLSAQAAAGDELALTEIRAILDANEALWRYLGDVEQTTLDYLIHVLLDAPHIKESTRRTVAELKVSLLSTDPTPLERLAVGRVVACWLLAHIVDRRVAHAINGDRVTGLSKLVEASEKRLQIAVRSLKLVRGMAPAPR